VIRVKEFGRSSECREFDEDPVLLTNFGGHIANRIERLFTCWQNLTGRQYEAFVALISQFDRVRVLHFGHSVHPIVGSSGGRV
jgi:hypothetical protein